MKIRSGRFNTGGSMLCSSNLKQDVAADCDLYRFHLKSQRTFGMCSVPPSVCPSSVRRYSTLNIQHCPTFRIVEALSIVETCSFVETLIIVA